jgi:hypothetical protein
MRARLIVSFAGIVAALLAAGAFAAGLGIQRSSAAGVTVAVTPVNLAPGARSWDFKVVLDTHSQDLSDDLLKSAVLLDGKGGRHSPLSWKGASPGGHHREGILSFKPLGPDVKTVELAIQRPAEPSPRTFRWQLE